MNNEFSNRILKLIMRSREGTLWFNCSCQMNINGLLTAATSYLLYIKVTVHPNLVSLVAPYHQLMNLARRVL